jgi:hypothetical protein
MHRESVYVCTYRAADGEHVTHVLAWDDREAAELCARELELELSPDAVEMRVSDIRVRPATPRREGADAAA